MRYRGLSSESRPLRWALFIAIVGLVIWFTGPEAMRTVAGWLGAEQESLPWFSSRILGFLGYYALAGSVIYGLLLSTGILDALSHRVVSFNLHQELSAVGIALVALHGAVLALDKFVAMTPVAIAVPFAAPYRPVWVGIGQLAFVLMVAIYASFYLRKQLGQRGWRILHYTIFLAFIGGTVHGLMAGTDTSAPWALWSYVGASALVVFLLGYRITLSVSRSRASQSQLRKEPT